MTAQGFYFTIRLSHWQRFKRLFTWHYIRQTSLVRPFYERWLSRG